MCLRSVCKTSILSLTTCALLLVYSTQALAGDRRPQELTLKNGKTLKGIVESADKDGVTLRLGPDALREVPWIQLTRRAFYRVRAALAKPDDGKARLKLAELGAELGLHREARLEFEKALALGAIGEKAFAKRVREAETAAVIAGLAQAKKRAEAGDINQALEVARELKLHFASAPNAKSVSKLIETLLVQVRELQAETQRDKEDLARLTKDVKRKQELLLRRLEAGELIRSADALAKVSAAKQKQGSVTRARKAADEADKKYTAARRKFGRLRRILPATGKDRAAVLAKLDELDRKHFDLLFGAAWFMWEGKIYSHAERYAARASYIDPVHPDLVELRDLLITSRIKYRLSDMTNARPIVR